MSFTYGFYNSKDGDRRYNASQISQIFDGVILDGVFMSIGDKFKVSAGTGMSVTVGTGRAWFDHTWSNNDSDMIVPITQSDVLLPRITAIVLETNQNEEARANSIKTIDGTPALVPVKPSLTKNDYVNQYPLAYITVPANATSISASNIENAVGTSDCPFVTGILEGMNIDNLVAQWNAQWTEWHTKQTEDYEAWMGSSKNEFTTWFNEIKGQLSEDAAGNLQNQINNIISSTPASDADTATGFAFIFNAMTLNTPYKTGDVDSRTGVIINANRDNGDSNMQMALIDGTLNPYVRIKVGGLWEGWYRLTTVWDLAKYMPMTGGKFTGTVQVTNSSVENAPAEGYFRNTYIKTTSYTGPNQKTGRVIMVRK